MLLVILHVLTIVYFYHVKFFSLYEVLFKLLFRSYNKDTWYKRGSLCLWLVHCLHQRFIICCHGNTFVTRVLRKAYKTITKTAQQDTNCVLKFSDLKRKCPAVLPVRKCHFLFPSFNYSNFPVLLPVHPGVICLLIQEAEGYRGGIKYNSEFLSRK